MHHICIFTSIMCGIAGIVYKRGGSPANLPHQQILELLKHRGPDFQSHVLFNHAALYHSRLEIVDTSEASNQPFLGQDKKLAMVFNGEIFNYPELQKQLDQLKTTGDTEVLFKLLSNEGLACLNRLNGFFAFGFYNAQQHQLLLARDRFGIKPLYYYNDDEKFAFASELKPLLKLTGKQALNTDQLYSYFRLNYSAGKQTFFKNIYRLLPGECIELDEHNLQIKTWYKAPLQENKHQLFDLLDDAVKLRLQADVPVGTFLSGGIDSSIISALAKKHKPALETFSIGFENEHYFDETHYSELVARHINSNHHMLKLKEDDFLANIDDFLNNIDEPFADSSAFNFYLLSKYTKQHVKVALSGDGADELFKGYNKHRALLLDKNPLNRAVARLAGSLASGGNHSRHGKLSNKLRQLKKFNQLAGLSNTDKQKLLATISSHDECVALIKPAFSNNSFEDLFKNTESFMAFTFEDTFDIQTVLADDMLVKADRFSMQHGIEIRNPFLDYRVVEFAMNLPEEQKINKHGQKLILKNSFADLLPPEIFTRSKKGFELPLQKWLSNQLRAKVEQDWLNQSRIESEGILNYVQVKAIQDKAFSANPGDSAAKLWAILVFQAWWKNNAA